MTTEILSFRKNLMNFRQKLLSLVLALLMIFTVNCLGVSAATVNTADLSANVSEMSNGNYQVDVKIILPNGAAFNTLQTVFNYDANAFTVVSSPENTSGLQGSLLNDRGGSLVFVWDADVDRACTETEITLFSLVFAVKSGVPSGKYDFTLTDVELLYDLVNEFDVTVNNASVTLVENLSYVTGTAVAASDGNYKIEVMLTLPSNTATSGIQVSLTYDSQAFTYVSSELGDIRDTLNHNAASKRVIFVYSANEPYSSNGSILLFSATFSINETAVTGNYSFEISCEDLVGSSVTSSLPVKTVSPSVSLVMNKISSDVYRVKNGYLGGIDEGTTAETVISGVHNSENISIKNSGILIDGTAEVKTNMDIILTIDGTVCDTLKIAINGDANGDGAVNILDFIRLKKYLADNDYTLIEVAVDLNDDDLINADDLIELCKLLLLK